MITASDSRPWKLSIVATSTPEAPVNTSSLSLRSFTWAIYGDWTAMAFGDTPTFKKVNHNIVKRSRKSWTDQNTCKSPCTEFSWVSIEVFKRRARNLIIWVKDQVETETSGIIYKFSEEQLGVIHRIDQKEEILPE